MGVVASFVINGNDGCVNHLYIMVQSDISIGIGRGIAASERVVPAVELKIERRGYGCGVMGCGNEGVGGDIIAVFCIGVKQQGIDARVNLAVQCGGDFHWGQIAGGGAELVINGRFHHNSI